MILTQYRNSNVFTAIGFSFVLLAAAGSELSAQVEYSILPLSLTGQQFSNGSALSNSGTYATGTSDAGGILWDATDGIRNLPAHSDRAFTSPNAVNDMGVVVGTGAATFFGSNPLPLIWTDGTTVAALPLPAGQTIGRANSVNNAGQAVGSVNGGSLEAAARFSTTSSSVITETLPNGGRLTTAFGINNAGRIVGTALDPNNAAVTKGYYLDPGAATATDIGALTDRGHNSAIPFAISSNGWIAGSSSLNSGADGRAFIWSESEGMREIPLLSNTTGGSARGVNANGWAVGTMASATSIPFLYDGNSTYALQDILDASGTGWDLISGTSNAALAIADNGVITGRGLFNGEISGFVMVPNVPEPTCLMLCGIATLAGLSLRRIT